jgi:hypothetical protein
MCSKTENVCVKKDPLYIQAILDFVGGWQINQSCFFPPPMAKNFCMLGLALCYDSSMLGRGCDRCVLSNKLILGRLHSNIQGERMELSQETKKITRLF